VPAGPQALSRMLELSGVFMAMTFVTFVGYGMCAAALRDRFLSRPQLVDRVRKIFAVSFLGLGARLSVESR
jgi:threonine/homoserine/homoserine lactone efflux protein